MQPQRALIVERCQLTVEQCSLTGLIKQKRFKLLSDRGLMGINGILKTFHFPFESRITGFEMDCALKQVAQMRGARLQNVSKPF